ncbi:hypothetical protein GS458_0364 [Geobacillus stearothermophilus]|nr:hypothetical protein GS458_0364 [Geobacillus stearothermophilus]
MKKRCSYRHQLFNKHQFIPNRNAVCAKEWNARFNLSCFFRENPHHLVSAVYAPDP